MNTTTSTFDPDALRSCREKLDEFYRVTEEMFDELVEQIAVLSEATNLTTLAAFCNEIGLNADWSDNELAIVPVGTLVTIEDNQAHREEPSTEDRKPEADRSKSVRQVD